jgi:hypothetical protein
MGCGACIVVDACAAKAALGKQQAVLQTGHLLSIAAGCSAG